MLTRFTDILDVALMAFLLYKLLTLLKTTSGTNLLKGVLIFLAVLFLSSILHLNGISFILSRMLEWGPHHPLPAGDPAGPGAGGQPAAEVFEPLLPGGDGL